MRGRQKRWKDQEKGKQNKVRGREKKRWRADRTTHHPNHLTSPPIIPSHPVKERAEQNEKRGKREGKKEDEKGEDAAGWEESSEVSLTVLYYRPPPSPFSHEGESWEKNKACETIRRPLSLLLEKLYSVYHLLFFFTVKQFQIVLMFGHCLHQCRMQPTCGPTPALDNTPGQWRHQRIITVGAMGGDSDTTHANK